MHAGALVLPPDARVRTHPACRLEVIAAGRGGGSAARARRVDEEEGQPVAKVLSAADAALLEGLRGGCTPVHEVRIDAGRLSALVLDGLVQVAAGGAPVDGPEAHRRWWRGAAPPEPSTATAAESRAALHHVARLRLRDPLRAAARLYCFGRIALSPRWCARLPDHRAVADHLGISAGARCSTLLERAWRPLGAAPADGWLLWARAGSAEGRRGSFRHKVYISPRPEHLREVFVVALEVLTDLGTPRMKVASDAAGVLRPDKLVAYFDGARRAAEAAAALAAALPAAAAQPVAFTAAVDGDRDGLVSEGADPPKEACTPDQAEPESWRLWVARRLGEALVAAARGPHAAEEPWRFALDRAGLDGVDVDRWRAPWAGEAARPAMATPTAAVAS